MTVVLLVLLLAVFAVFGTAKVAAVAPMPAKAAHLGFTVDQYRGIGALEPAGVAGLLVGRLWHPLTLAAGCGLIALLLGAAWAHISHHDHAPEVAAPVVVIWAGGGGGELFARRPLTRSGTARPG